MNYVDSQYEEAKELAGKIDLLGNGFSLPSPFISELKGAWESIIGYPAIRNIGHMRLHTSESKNENVVDSDLAKAIAAFPLRLELHEIRNWFREKAREYSVSGFEEEHKKTSSGIPPSWERWQEVFALEGLSNDERSVLSDFLQNSERFYKIKGISREDFATPAICHAIGKRVDRFSIADQIASVVTLSLYEKLVELVAGAVAPTEAINFSIDGNFPELTSSLLAKPFTILTGASGTGKTKVAESLAKALANEDGSNSAVVAVGSDWTDSRNVLGFVNHLREGENKLPIYQSTSILDLLLEASAEKNEDLPYFLILDEMNLSHVERYFADFLSAMERSEGELALHQEGDDSTRLQRSPEQEGDVPQSLPYPQNLFVIGTVNIDETTYMFSPKVLDRANVIEFAVDSDDIGSFLAEPKDYEMAEKASAGVAEGFLALAKQGRQLKDGLEGLPEGPKGQVDGHLLALFKILKAHRYEYGYRTAAEVTKYLRVCRHLADDKTKWDAEGWQGSLDEQIVQKLLPKLHGSVGRIGDLLAVLGCYCYNGSEKENSRLNDLLNLKEGVGLFPKSFAKLQSMAQTLRDEQFVSFIQ